MAQERYTNLKVHGEPRTERNILGRESARQFVTAECGQTKVDNTANSFLYILYIQKKHRRDAICLPKASIGIAQQGKTSIFATL